MLIFFDSLLKDKLELNSGITLIRKDISVPGLFAKAAMMILRNKENLRRWQINYLDKINTEMEA